jgi:integrase/recombinase XerD
MTKPISPLRQRMIDDMTMRNLSANTQETYIRSVAQFSAFHRWFSRSKYPVVG